MWAWARAYVFAAFDGGVVEGAFAVAVLGVDGARAFDRGIAHGHAFEHLMELGHVLGVHAHKVVQRTRPVVRLRRRIRP